MFTRGKSSAHLRCGIFTPKMSRHVYERKELGSSSVWGFYTEDEPVSSREARARLIFGVKPFDVFLCCATIAVLLLIVLPSLFSFFYVCGELDKCTF